MQIEHTYSLEKARAAGDRQAISELENIGPPPYDSLNKFQTHFKWLGRYEAEPDRVAESSLIGKMIFGAPNFSLRDISNRSRGFGEIPARRLCQEVLNTDLTSLGMDFRVPIFFFQGMEDEVTPTALAKGYFDKINAPRKEFVTFVGGGHFAVWSMPDKFLQELVARVRPLAAQT